MTRQEKSRIRCRDRRWYNKLHGAVPEGMTIHHKYYNELQYDEDSFVIITKEEHERIHGHAVQCGKGIDTTEYYSLNKEEISARRKERYNPEAAKAYRETRKEEIKERSRNYNAKVKAVRMSNGLSCKEWNALTKEDRKRLMDTFMVNGGIMI